MSYNAPATVPDVFPSGMIKLAQAKNKVRKGAWRMPWLTEAMKDVISCDKLRVGANNP